MHNVFVIGDLHFNHTNILTLENRPFDSVEAMNLALIKNWNNIVGKFDHVYVLGDFAFGKCSHILSQLKGVKILVMGNHDRRKSTKQWIAQGFHQVINFPIIYTCKQSVHYNNKFIFSHEPIDATIGSGIGYFKNVCAHKHSKGISDANHFFVSVELTNYKPVNITVVDDYFNNFKGDLL